jgi:hypothetical protein
MWLTLQPADPEMSQRRRDLEAATAKVADLRAEQTATVARRGEVDRTMLSSAPADRPPLHHELVVLEGELRALARLLEAAEGDRLRASLAALSRVDALTTAELEVIEAAAATPRQVLRGCKTDQCWEEARVERGQLARLREREQRAGLVRSVVHIQVRQIGDDIDVANPRTWDAAVAKAAARTMVRAA